MNLYHSSSRPAAALPEVLGIVLHRDGFTTRLTVLVNALVAQLGPGQLVHVFELPPRWAGLEGAFMAAGRAVDRAIARQRETAASAASLAGPDVIVHPTSMASLVLAVREVSVDLLIDLRGVPLPLSLVAATRSGALQLLCDDQPEDFTFSGARLVPGKQVCLSLALHPPSGESARPLWKCVHMSSSASGSQLWYDRGLLAGRFTTLIVRVLQDLRIALPPNVAASPIKAGAPALLRLARSVAAAGRTIVARLKRARAMPDQWFMAVQAKPASFITQGHPLVASNLNNIPQGSHQFLADPCLIEWQGRQHIFFEDYVYARLIGVIAWAEILPSGRTSEPVCVLEQPYHLSYPFVFAHAGELYMIPESSANLSVDLYRAVDFPTRWEMEATLLSGVNAVDATLHHDGRHWWMFVNIGEHGGCTNDELFIYQAEQLTGPWQAHVHNPVKRGLRGTRPAGRLFLQDGRLMRPTQDCSKVYGGGIVIQCVDRLSLTEFDEHEMGHYSAAVLPGCDGLHTVSATAQFEVIDARRKGP